jgi:hypothetical protein
VLDSVSVKFQLPDVLDVPEVMRLWLAVSDTLWLELQELPEAVVLTDTLADFVSAGVAVAVPLLDLVSLCVWLKLAETLAVRGAVGVADQVMLELSLELPVWDAVAISVIDLVVVNDGLTTDDAVKVGLSLAAWVGELRLADSVPDSLTAWDEL